MEDRQSNIDRNLNTFLTEYKRERSSSAQLEEARRWYREFTGKEYTNDSQELLDIYKSLKEIA